MDGIFPYVIAAVVVLFVIVILMLVVSRKNKNGYGESASRQKPLTTKNQAQIIRDANKKLARDPHDASALASLGDVYYASKLWEKAYPIYDELSKLAVTNTTIDNFTVNLRAGVSALQLKKYPEAITLLPNAYKVNPHDFDVNYNLGLACYLNNSFDKAVPCFKKSLVIRPDAHGVYGYLAQSFYKQKHYRDSLPCFKKALDEDPSNKEVLYCMADAMTAEGMGDKALKVFMHLRADPVYGAKSSLAAGTIHARNKDNQAAIQDLEICLKHKDAEPEVRQEGMYRLAQCYIAENQMTKGLELLKEIRNANPNYKDVNTLISRYQELSQNSNLQVYLVAGQTDFIALCRKIVVELCGKQSRVKIEDINMGSVYTDIVAFVSNPRWEDTQLFRFFRTNGSTGELYLRDFHGHMKDVNSDRGFCITAGTFTEEAHKYTEGRPIDLVEKLQLTKILKAIG